MSSVIPTLGCPSVAFRVNDPVELSCAGSPPADGLPRICKGLEAYLWMRVTEFSDDGVLQLFDCLEIVGIDDFTEEVSEEEV